MMELKSALRISANLGVKLSMRLPTRLPKGLPKGLSMAIAITLGFTPQSSLAITRATDPNLRQTYRPCRQQGKKHFQVIIYGDEPAGLMTALELSRQLGDGAKSKKPRIAVVTSADIRKGLGGTISRAGLAYLDRNQVPHDMWNLLPPFAPSSQLYEKFLQLTGAGQIAVNPRSASRVFKQALHRANISVLPAAQLAGVSLEGNRLCALKSRRHGELGADIFIDSSLGAELAHRAGVSFLHGLGQRGLSHESIALGWIFEVEGMTLSQLQILEDKISQRLLDPKDYQAQQWLQLWPAYLKDRRRLQMDLLDDQGNPKQMYTATHDSADQRSPALSIAFHGQLHRLPGLKESPARLDAANIAVLGSRLSFNSLLFRNDAEQNRQVIAKHGSPLPWMWRVANDVTHFFISNGAKRVTWMPELYIRSADQIAKPSEALSAQLMAQGGVPRQHALGTFTYALDFRGSSAKFIPSAKPTFNFGYRHTLPREISNLAVLGPSSGFAGLGEGAGRIIELNISVGQGLAIASSLSLARKLPLAAVNPQEVVSFMPAGYTPYGRPSNSTSLNLLFRQLQYLFDSCWSWLYKFSGLPRLRCDPRVLPCDGL
jgi:hypothetical protein